MLLLQVELTNLQYCSCFLGRIRNWLSPISKGAVVVVRSLVSSFFRYFALLCCALFVL